MLMAAVSGIDHGNRRFAGGHVGGAFLRMADRADIGVGGDDADRVRNAFPLGGGAGIGRRKTKNRPSQIQHCGFKA